ncbi:MAG: polysaccharide deacetylase family protein, partial [Alicyclobacillus sp.]|nr:polysaccharide deacetylase family protein [Alicyclobacillus sp.]
MGSPDIAPQILGKGAPGYLFDLARALAAHVPLSAVPVAIIVVLVGVIAGLDGSGFSGLVLVGTLALALGTPIGVNIAVLAALGQMGSVWSGGGTLVPWGVLDVAGVTGVDPEALTRRNFLPVIRATFCCNGARVQQYPALTKRIVAYGHQLVNHSFTHPNFYHLSETQASEQLENTRSVLTQITGVDPRWFRPPYGANNLPCPHKNRPLA